MIARPSPRLRARVLCWIAGAAVAAAAMPASAQLRLPGGSPSPAAADAAAKGPAQAADYIVAVVNSEPITNGEVRARATLVAAQVARRGGALPPRPELLRQVLDRLVSERAQVQAARDAGLKIDEAQVDQAERNVARQNQIDVAELHRRLAGDGISVAAFREDLRRQLLLSRVREREADPRGRISDGDIEQYLRERAAAAEGASAELNLAQLLVAVPENATAAQVEALRVRAVDLQRRARAGEDFAALARQGSDAPGGAFGLRPADRYPTLFLEAVQSLPVGGVSEVVRSGAGFHVLKVVERQSPGMVVTQSHARHILLRPGPELTEAAARARLAEFKRRIEAGQADFATLARQYSQDASASAGGDLGWANPGMFVPEFEDAMNDLEPGAIADPLVSRFGVHLIQLIERREVALSPQEQRQVARNALREKRAEENYARWAETVRNRAWVEMREPPQ